MAMRSMQKTIPDKKSRLLSAFAQNTSLSIADIQAALDCNRQSAHNYLKRLEEEGYQIQSEIVQRKAYYSLKSPDLPGESEEYLPMTVDVIRKYHMVQELQKRPSSRAELLKKLTAETDGISGLDIHKSTFYKLIKNLELEGEIVLKGDRRFYPTGKSIPINIELEDPDDILNELQNITAGHPYYEQLHSVCQKVGQLVGYVDDDDIYRENYLHYGRKHVRAANIDSQLEMLRHTEYKSRILEIEYSPDDYSASHVCLFATGMIIYCLEKDSIYLLGTGKSIDQSEEYPYTIIKLSTIRAIKNTEMPNACYHSEAFNKITETMLSISIEAETSVMVEFRRTNRIERELEHFFPQRRFARLEKKSDTIVYTDIIRGISDFANYLRQFGDDIIKLEPEELRDRMLFSVNRSLNAYLSLEE